ncbi:hypothetical protein [Cellulomonas sp. P5_E12]
MTRAHPSPRLISWHRSSRRKAEVMADAADLVEVRHVLHQIVNVKGD